jgi:ribosomal protein S18 acetylase RimI-like enzyme
VNRVFWTAAGIGRRARKRVFRQPEIKSVVPDSESFCIGRVAVDPGHRRQGVAKRLLAEMESRAAALGFLNMHLFVDGRNVAAVSCYQVSGWKIISSRNQNVTMAKEIAAALPRAPQVAVQSRG